MRTYDINQYALKLRRSGKLLREIGEELGVSKERARTRVIMGTRQEKVFERGKNATTMGDLFMSYKPMAAIKHLEAENMTFTEFLENISQQTLVETIHIGKAAVKEILYELRKKNVPEEIIQNWEGVKFVKIKKTKKKRRDAGIPNGPEEKHDTCQRYVIDKGRRVMGKLCNEPLTSKQKKFCAKHKP
jgi:predicted DNA-binding transcriptional regulator